MEQCRDLLGQWGKRAFPNFRHQRRKITRALRMLEMAHKTVLEQRRVLESGLEELEANEEEYWEQRIRVDYLRGGDKNTQFFHRKAFARRKRNTIKKTQK
ncbi:unnamed protein product [Linum trigynum]|uniref:Uncharacterized protein n=1 Tax=Linum trigynum TaxID=586398 RepID=A0AAV2CG30_9ROSI